MPVSTQMDASDTPLACGMPRFSGSGGARWVTNPAESPRGLSSLPPRQSGMLPLAHPQVHALSRRQSVANAQIYKAEEVTKAKLDVLKETNMVDFAMDIHRELYPDVEVPEGGCYAFGCHSWPGPVSCCRHHPPVGERSIVCWHHPTIDTKAHLPLQPVVQPWPRSARQSWSVSSS